MRFGSLNIIGRPGDGGQQQRPQLTADEIARQESAARVSAYLKIEKNCAASGVTFPMENAIKGSWSPAQAETWASKAIMAKGWDDACALTARMTGHPLPKPTVRPKSPWDREGDE